ncbi:S8 family serine peptidase [Actinophytocola sp. S1-96]|uniref:S8 family serine peptidase n=2 Tax=Actinophytocola gossypii TaxID=2812003 RepID=A0ABT2JFY5_9PSEU|nr:S8 family serine peptidase [Actinophytocola gossypii]
MMLATNLVTTGMAATAQPLDERPACSDSRPELRYLVLFDDGTTRPAASAEVDAACGRLTGYYPQIAVAVATSADPRFDERLGTDRAFSAQRVVESQQGPDQHDDGAESTKSLVTAKPEAVSTVDRTGEQWDMTLIGADRARRIDQGSRDVVVGVLDSGVDPNHPDLRNALAPSLSAGCLSGVADTSRAAWVPTVSPHGTHVAGTIAAADDGRGTAGVAPGVRVASVKVVDDEGFIFPEYAVCGLMWASANKMAVTNNSYFVDPWLMTCNRDSEHVVFEAVRRAVDHATREGVLTVAAATNEGVDLADPEGRTDESRTLDASCKVLPAGLRGVVAVSAVGEDELKSGYSSYGLGVIDVAAPGGEPKDVVPSDSETATEREDGCVLSTVPDGYDRLCGTSMAAPHVSGVAALLAGEHPEASPKALTRMLTEQADEVACPADYDLDGTGAQDAYCEGYEQYNGFYGHGVVDAEAALTSDAGVSPEPEVSGSGDQDSGAGAGSDRGER